MLSEGGVHLHSQFARSGHRSLRTSMLLRPWEVSRMTAAKKKEYQQLAHF